jgi:hypothetical protein
VAGRKPDQGRSYRFSRPSSGPPSPGQDSRGIAKAQNVGVTSRESLVPQKAKDPSENSAAAGRDPSNWSVVRGRNIGWPRDGDRQAGRAEGGGRRRQKRRRRRRRRRIGREESERERGLNKQNTDELSTHVY